MLTRHTVHIADARWMGTVEDASVHLVVTSPPYPMVEMWDDGFARTSTEAATALSRGNGAEAFEAMHRVLDAAWAECARVLAPGGFACINVGDAVRTLGEQFQLYPNHSRVSAAFMRLGLTPLPDILWRKPTNAPNKFMGSGMLPAGAYVTYEHEYVLIFRKGGKRVFSSDADRARRARSAFFWEERNVWFSDLWMDLRGTSQHLAAPEARARSGAFPFELPFRLIQMYSLAGDTVLDPFVGTGTTMAAALASARNSVGVECEPDVAALIPTALDRAVALGASRQAERLRAHEAFVAARLEAGKSLAHRSTCYDVPVMTRQETAIELYVPDEIVSPEGGATEARHRLLRAGESEGAQKVEKALPQRVATPQLTLL